jgi:hypothetical protein
MASFTTVCTATSVLPALRQRHKPSTRSAFGSQLKAALEHANRLTEMHGIHNTDTVNAWETVKELLKSHPYFSSLVVSDWSLDELA